MRKNLTSVYAVMLFQSLIASGTHIVAKIVVRDIEPFTLTMLRSAMAAVALVVVMMFRKTRITFSREHYKSIIYLSILAIPINQFLFLTAIKYTTPANAALLYSTTPAVVLVLSYFFGKEQLSLRKSLGVVIAFCGVFLIIFERGVSMNSSFMFGNLLLLIAVISWALYTTNGRPMVLTYGAFPTSAATMILGTLLYVPIGLYNTAHFDFSTLTFAHWGGLLYLSLGTSIFAYFLWYYALERIEASKVAIFSNLQPVLTTILSAVLLGQTVTATFIIGGIIALSGVILTQIG